jgi:hypothetical protein
MRSVSRAFLAGLVVFLAAGALTAQGVADADNIPNWAAAPFWSPSAGGGIHTMTDISDSIPFVATAPCRLADTRAPAGFAGQAGGPILAANATRTFQIAGVVPGLTTQCGIPVAAPPGPSVNNGGTQAVSFMFTIIQPNSAGNLIAWPVGAVPFNTSVLNYEGGIFSIGNGITVGINTTTGAINVYLNAPATAHLTIDVNGYYGTTSGDQFFYWVRNTTGFYGAGRFANSNTSGSQTFALTTVAASTGTGTSSIFAEATGGGSTFTFGVKARTASTGFDSAGVKGFSGYGDTLGDTIDCGPCFAAGVRGTNGADGNTGFGFGVLGLTRGAAGVGGFLLASTGTGVLARGYLGASFGVDTGAGSVAPWGVFSQGDSGTSGIKAFVEPHPTDPSKVIRYISLEGPEAGTYFRGKGRFERGIANIGVPEDFRLVTDPEGLSIQVTPIGDMATVAVVSIGLDRIVVKASRNVEFFYTVNGVRATYKDRPVIIEGGEFRPQKAGATMPEYLSEGQKRLLIQNGTYKPDGTINMETAQRLGWDRVWERDRQTPTPQPE